MKSFKQFFSEEEVTYKGKEVQIGKHDSRPDESFSAEELALGIKIEHEHTGDEHTAKEIAKDHLSEIPDYYSRLTKMEKNAGVKTEEFQSLDELSKGLLNRYKDASRAHSHYIDDDPDRNDDDPVIVKKISRNRSRSYGLDLARAKTNKNGKTWSGGNYGLTAKVRATEETEHLDELSKNKLTMYIGTAASNAASLSANAAYKLSGFNTIGNKDTGRKEYDKSRKRLTNIWKASRKLANKTTYESLAPDATAGDYIKDFVHSDNSRFSGDSKKKRIKRALAAYFGKNKE